MPAPSLPNPQQIVDRLRTLQRHIRHAVIASHDAVDLAQVHRVSSADTIYGIDAVIEPVIEKYLEEWGREQPLVLVAEGIEPESGRVFPAGAKESDAKIRLLIDPIDGTRGLMYDKRAAWSLAGAAVNHGDATRLRDIDVAVMTELPTSKMGSGDVLWSIRGQGAHAVREVLTSADVTPASAPHLIEHSTATSIKHGFAMVSNFFPGTKVLAAELMEHIIGHLLGPADVNAAMVFEDQYISTGGQFYELIVGHDRFNADLRPLFYKIQKQPEGLCCHPYDCATLLIAEESGVVITNGLGAPLDSPMDVTTGLSWAAYANQQLQSAIEPLLTRFLRERGG